MKILLVGEYSNVHATLAKGLRELGHQVTVLSNGDFWKDYPRDINMVRKPGKLNGIKYYFKLLTILPRLHGYDVVQLINPMFLELRAERIMPFFRHLRFYNKKVFLGAFGMDYYWVHECITKKVLRYSDFNIGNQVRTDDIAMKDIKDWVNTAKESLTKRIAHSCDGIITGLYEYDVCYRPLFPEKTTFIPYPIVMPELKETEKLQKPKNEKVKFFIGISKGRSEYKGTNIMLKALERLQQDYPDKVEIIKAEGVPFEKYQQMLDGADVLLDQLYSYTPAMNGLLALSKGIILIGGGEEEHYQILGEYQLRPIVNVLPDENDVYEKLLSIINHPEEMQQRKIDGIKYVAKHHDYIKVARQYEALYQNTK